MGRQHHAVAPVFMMMRICLATISPVFLTPDRTWMVIGCLGLRDLELFLPRHDIAHGSIGLERQGRDHRLNPYLTLGAEALLPPSAR